MKISNIHMVYFSATYTTQKIVKAVAEQFNAQLIDHDITQSLPNNDIICGNNDVLVIGMPVYAGRIPAQGAKAISKLVSSNTPAIIVCVYGNRDYDDALLELKELVEDKGFKIISAAAFIAQHSIFPQIAEHRPDAKDMELVRSFGDKSNMLISNLADSKSVPSISVKGNKPLIIPALIPLKPTGNTECNRCGVCVSLCPTQAIPADTPQETIADKCISCGRCIVVCNQKSRNFYGELYEAVSKKFINDNSTPKEPETIYAM